MKVFIDRVQLDPDVTIGRLRIEGSEFACFTCEDTVRPDGVKVYGETAIPAGTYDVQITYSKRFDRMLPLLMNVQGFVGIRIHPGNTAADTDGCVLVGLDRLPKSIGRSRLAFEPLFADFSAAKARGERISLTIANQKGKP